MSNIFRRARFSDQSRLANFRNLLVLLCLVGHLMSGECLYFISDVLLITLLKVALLMAFVKHHPTKTLNV